MWNPSSQYLDFLARTLYDPQRSGVLIIRGPQHTPVEDLRTDFLHAMPHMREPEPHGDVVQDFCMLYWGAREAQATPPIPLPYIDNLIHTLNTFYRRLGARAGFSGEANSFGMHIYGAASEGIGLHRDRSVDRNLILSYTVAGNAPFRVADTEEGDGERAYPVGQGSLVLMRAPRNDMEKPLRPYHAAGVARTERLTVLLRTRV